MKYFILLVACLFVATPQAEAQKYITRNGTVYFKSNAEVDDGVEAYNRTVGCVLDISTGDIAFQLLIKSFTFKKALMQEHFNENYMESDKYPKATFKGKVLNIEKIDLTKDGEHDVILQGELTIRNISKTRKENARLIVKNGKIMLECSFQVANADHNIKIPSLVADKVAKIIDVDFQMELEKL